MKENNLLIKVCGLNDKVNMEELVSLQPDFIGFIFYEKSKRFIQREEIKIQYIRNLKNVNKVGVFVNANKEEVMEAVKSLDLQFVQLHGDESPEFCADLQRETKVIKAFRIAEKFDFKITEPYLQTCEYFLFDCFTEAYGGSGQKFNWRQLSDFPFNKKYFLSGGIKPTDATAVKELNLPGLFAIDINSGFEIAPGLKNTSEIKNFINEIRN